MRSALLAAVACACGLLLSDWGGAAVSPAPLVTPTELPGVLARYWAANNQANERESVALQGEDEQGSAAAIDDEAFVVARAFDESVHSTPPPFTPFSQPYGGGAVSRQARYPLVALVLSPTRPAQSGGYCATPSSDAFVFVRDASAAPWRVSLEPLVTTSLMPRIANGDGGFAAPVPSDAHLAIPLGSLAAALAGDMARYAYSSGPGTGLPVALAPTVRCWMLPDLADERAAADGEDLDASVTVHPADGTQPAWEIAGGGAFVLLTLDASMTFHARGGRSLTPQSVPWIINGEDAAFTIRAGDYRTITYTSATELAVVDPPAGHDAQPHVIGAYWGLLPGSTSP